MRSAQRALLRDLAPALYFVPVPTVILIACGVIDVSRHKKVTYELIAKYFMGNGILTWMLSPINLLADLFSYRNKGQYEREDMPSSTAGKSRPACRNSSRAATSSRRYPLLGPDLHRLDRTSLQLAHQTTASRHRRHSPARCSCRVVAPIRDVRFVDLTPIIVLELRQSGTITATISPAVAA
jgi:hypothetical protein